MVLNDLVIHPYEAISRSNVVMYIFHSPETVLGYPHNRLCELYALFSQPYSGQALGDRVR